MEFYTFDSVNLVLADMTGTLGLSSDEASWLLTVYSCSLFFGVPICFWLADYVGFKRFLLGSTIIFAMASIGCSASSSLPTLLVWRAIQGFAGAGLINWWRASIYVLLPKSKRSSSMMKVSTALYLSSAIGLLLSGFLTDRFNWRFIFLPDVISAGAAVCLLLRFYPNELPPTRSKAAATDWLGISLLSVALITVQIVLNRGEIDDWFGSSLIRILSCISVISLALFLAWQTSPRNREPLLNLSLLRDRRLLSSIFIGLFAGMILSGSLYVLPEFLRNVSAKTYSATQTGRIICIYAFTAAIVRRLILPLIANVGQRKTMIFSFTMLIASMLIFQYVLTTDTPIAFYVLPLVLYGLCVTSLLPAIGSGTVGKIEEEQLLDAVALYMTFRQFGASLGVALLNVLLDHRETLHSSRLFEHLHKGEVATAAGVAARASNAVKHGFSQFDAHLAGFAQLAEAAKRQSETLSYADAFGFMATIGFVALFFIPIAPPTPPAPK
jgi:DHA2 family multidrug resistance protein